MVSNQRSDSRSPALSDNTVQLTRLEAAFIVGIVGCLFFATWQLGEMLAEKWLVAWVGDSELREDLIYYGVAFSAAIAALAATARSAFPKKRFGRTVGRAFLWYGALLLISVSAMGAFEYLPEVAAGLVGAALLATAVYVIQQRYFTQERIERYRLQNDNCPQCGEPLRSEAHFCPQCGYQMGRACPECNGYVTLHDTYCTTCGFALDKQV